MKNFKYLFLFLALFILCHAFYSIYDFNSNNNLKNKKSSRIGIRLSPQERAYYNSELEFMKTRDPKTNSIPQNIKYLESKFISKLPKKDEFSNSYRIGSNNNYKLQTQHWSMHGPTNFAGRLNCVALDKQNENILLVGAASGGIWRSMDRGLSWLKTFPPDANHSIYCITQDIRQNKENNWYCGTGELLSTTNRRIDSVPRTIGVGNGILKSTDNGLSWNILTSTSGTFLGKLYSPFQMTWKIILDSKINSQDVVFAACYGGIYRSTDGGDSWKLVLGDETNKSFCTDIVQNSNGVFYAALSTYSVDAGKPQKSGIWRSTDGLVWNQMINSSFPQNFRTLKLAVSEANPDYLWILTEYPLPDGLALDFLYSEHTLWQYIDDNISGNGTWFELTKYLPGGGLNTRTHDGLNTLGGYAMVLAVKQDNENIIYVGGNNLYRSLSGFTDSNTVQIGGYPYDLNNSSLHPDQHGVCFSYNNSSNMFAVTDGGIYYTSDNEVANVAWRPLNTGLVTTQFYSIGIDEFRVNDNFLMGGLQDNFTMFTNNGTSNPVWTGLFGGDGMSVSVPKDKNFAIGSCYFGSIYTTRFNPNMESQNPWGDYQTPSFLNSEDFTFYNRFILDPVSNKIFYLVAKNRIFRKDDISKSAFGGMSADSGWTELTNTKVTGKTETITSIGISQNPANRLYYGTSYGRLFRLDNSDIGNPVPMEITGIDFPQNGFLACIDVDPNDADKIFAVFSNYNIQSIFYSSNGGGSWGAVGGNLEEQPDGGGSGPSIRWVKYLTYNDQTIYFAATSSGLFSTTELSGMSTVWEQEGATTIGNVIIEMIAARPSDGYVAIATQGAGIWTSNVSYISSVPCKPEGCNLNIDQNYPNPVSGVTYIQFSIPETGFVKIQLYDMSGKLVSVLLNDIVEKGDKTILCNTESMISGKYIYKLDYKNNSISRIMTVIR